MLIHLWRWGWILGKLGVWLSPSDVGIGDGNGNDNGNGNGNGTGNGNRGGWSSHPVCWPKFVSTLNIMIKVKFILLFICC